MSAADASTGLGELPEEVRLRVLALTADVLPLVPTVPPALRKVAAFAPGRRARLGASAIGAALADDDFRDRVAVQVEGRPASTRAGDDPAERGAVSWLVRPEGWQESLAAVAEALAGRTGTAPPVDDGDKWRDRAQASEQALREARSRHRAELTELKAENVLLRRKLGDARTKLRDAAAAAEEAGAVADDVRQRAEAVAAAQDRELRQLRAQVERHEAEALTGRRTARADKDEATIRARLLLETVIDAASGLRRELSLPSVAGAPGDRVEAQLAADETRRAGPAGATPPTSPAQLEQYLTLPRARMIVDGYNVSKTAWPSSSLEAQRIRLLNGLAPVVARTGAETTVVFDAAASTNRPVVSVPRGVKVRFSPEGVIADDVIRDLVAAEPEGRVVIVVTNDREVGVDVVREGARAVASESLVGLIERSG